MKSAKTVIDNVYEKMEKQQAQAKKRRALTRKITASVGSMCLVAALVLVAGLGMGKAPDMTLDATPGTTPEKAPEQTVIAGYTVLLDVNPSIEISVSEEDTILGVQNLNPEAAAIIKDKNIEGQDLPEGVSTLVEELADQGYISEEANSVLVSIEGAEKEKADQVKDKLSKKIKTCLKEKKVDGSVVVQELPANSAASLKDVAAEYGISPGKAQMIAQIIAKNGLHTYEELAPMSVHQLNVLRHEYYVNHDGVQVNGNPSTATYIGETKAVEVATTAAGVTPAETKVELTCHKGSMVYCVEFEDDTYDYRYRVNAVTAEILSAEKVQPGKDKFFQGEVSTDMIGERAALNAALAHAGVENGKLIRCKCKTDWVNNMAIYDIYFTDGITSGTYVVNARTGEIVKYNTIKEKHDRSVSAAVIGEQKAMDIALAKDGLVDGNVSKYEMNLKQKGDAYYYDLMFICDGVKYMAEIAAEDGQVLSLKKGNLKDTGAPAVETEKMPAAESEMDKPKEKDKQNNEEKDAPKETGKHTAVETEKHFSKEG